MRPPQRSLGAAALLALWGMTSSRPAFCRASAPPGDPQAAFERAVRVFEERVDSMRPGAKNEGNLPFIRTHGRPMENSALLVHGLTDSPYFMKALADILYDEGFNVVGIRLAGHGTRPEDLLAVTLQEWRRDVEFGLETAEALGRQISLVGFSTGGALVLDAVAKNHARRRGRTVLRRFHRPPEAAGPPPRDLSKLVLMSPAIEIKDPRARYMCLAPWAVTLFKPYRESSPETIVEDAPHRYKKMAINAVCQLNALTRGNARRGGQIRAEMAAEGVAVFTVQSRADETVSAPALEEFLKSLPPEIKQESIWYPEELGIEHGNVTRPELNPRFQELKERLRGFLSGGQSQSPQDAAADWGAVFQVPPGSLSIDSFD